MLASVLALLQQAQFSFARIATLSRFSFGGMGQLQFGL